jgi:hypothetical protein
MVSETAEVKVNVSSVYDAIHMMHSAPGFKVEIEVTLMRR